MPHCMNKLDQHIFSEIQEVYVLNWCVILNWLWNGVEHNTHIFVLQYFICCVLMKRGTWELVSLNIAFPLQRRKISRFRGNLPGFYCIFRCRKLWEVYYDKVTFQLGKTARPRGGYFDYLLCPPPSVLWCQCDTWKRLGGCRICLCVCVCAAWRGHMCAAAVVIPPPL